jgi:hypothetical protein
MLNDFLLFFRHEETIENDIRFLLILFPLPEKRGELLATLIVNYFSVWPAHINIFRIKISTAAFQKSNLR